MTPGDHFLSFYKPVQNVTFQEIVLTTVYPHMWRLVAGSHFRRYRYIAYRQFVRLCWGHLGRDVRVSLPYCAVHMIRKTFPSADYTASSIHTSTSRSGEVPLVLSNSISISIYWPNDSIAQTGRQIMLRFIPVSDWSSAVRYNFLHDVHHITCHQKLYIMFCKILF